MQDSRCRIKRCSWANGDPLYEAYHDREWGVPQHDDIKLFEMMVLDAFQAGLSWLIILKKREAFRKAFEDFAPHKIETFDEARVQGLLQDKGIVRNEKKIRATINNARAFLRVRAEYGTFDRYIWQFTSHRTIVNRYRNTKQIPNTTPESDAMSANLRARGFAFVGSTICYSFMQAAGMVNDHVWECPRYREICRLAGKKTSRAPGR